jgi:CRP-like cAMP-binding protein
MEADWGENLMVVISGLAKVRSFNADGEESVLSLVGGGELLGEISVLDGDARSADVVTLSTVRLLKLQGRGFQAVLAKNVNLALGIARLEAARLRDLNRRFGIQKSDATTRLLDALAYLARKSSGVDDPLALMPPLSQGEIAILAGLARETASRTMSKLKTKGVVLEEEGCLRLSSLDPLRKRGLVV